MREGGRQVVRVGGTQVGRQIVREAGSEGGREAGSEGGGRVPQCTSSVSGATRLTVPSLHPLLPLVPKGGPPPPHPYSQQPLRAALFSILALHSTDSSHLSGYTLRHGYRSITHFCFTLFCLPRGTMAVAGSSMVRWMVFCSEDPTK